MVVRARIGPWPICRELGVLRDSESIGRGRRSGMEIRIETRGCAAWEGNEGKPIQVQLTAILHSCIRAEEYSLGAQNGADFSVTELLLHDRSA